jgi:hypothetical protein
VIAAFGSVVSHWTLGAGMVTGVRRVSAQVVWVAKDDGSDIIRADAIAGVGRDYNGNITARASRGRGFGRAPRRARHARRPAPAH